MGWVDGSRSPDAAALARGGRSALVAAMFSLVALFSSCASAPPASRAGTTDIAQDDDRACPSTQAALSSEGPGGPRATAESVVLVTLDGVRWQEVFGGVDAELLRGASDTHSRGLGARELLPNLYRLFFDGGTVLGAPGEGEGIAASGPRYVSLPAYLELMTAASPTCWSNDCDPLVGWTVAEALATRGPFSSAVYASWDHIEDVFRDAPQVSVRAGRTPGDGGPTHPGHGRYRPDRETAQLAVDHLERHRPRFLWVALGDTDEWAHRGDYRGYLDALRFADAFVGDLMARALAIPGYGERSAFFVATDHGRDPGFADHGGKASAAVWLMARGPGIAAAGTVPSGTRRHLRDVAPTILALLGEPSEACAECGTALEEIVGRPGPLVDGHYRTAQH